MYKEIRQLTEIQRLTLMCCVKVIESAASIAYHAADRYSDKAFHDEIRDIARNLESIRNLLRP